MEQIEERDLNKLIQNSYNSIEYIRLSKLLHNQDSFLGITKSEFKENIHSNFLYWLLNPYSNHDLSDYPIKRYIACVFEILTSSNYRNKNEILSAYDEHLINAFLTMNYNIRISNEDIIPEYTILGGRIDIYLKFTAILSDEKKEYNINLVIENKVKSKENNVQTNTYFEHFNNNYKDAVNIYTYLLPLPNKKLIQLFESIAECKNFITVNYQTITDSVIENCYEMTNIDYVRRAIKEYCFSLSKSYITKNKEEFIMAYSRETKDLIEQFWNKNVDLMEYIFQYKENQSIEEGKSEIVIQAYKNITEDIETEKNARQYFDSYESLVKYLLDSGKISADRIKIVGNIYNSIQNLLKRKYTENTDYFVKFSRSQISFVLDLNKKTEFIAINFSQSLVYLKTEKRKKYLPDFFNKNSADSNLAFVKFANVDEKKEFEQIENYIFESFDLVKSNQNDT